MLQKLKQLWKPDLQPLNTIKISKSKILHNLRLIQQRQPNAALFPVLKSNAYGHGIIPLLQILKGQNFPYLAVDSFPEYQIIVRNSDFKVLMMGETLPQNYRFFDLKRTAFAVFSLPVLEALGAMKSKVSIHLFLNTGMNREGIQEADLPDFLSLLKRFPNLQLEGLMSHFHSADADPASIDAQIARFKKMTKLIEAAGFSLKRKHISASAGILQVQDDFFTACRPGLLLYGYSPVGEGAFEDKTAQLQPALNLFSTIIAIQKLNLGDGISYNHRRKAKESWLSATIPFGYYEGRLRTLSGKLHYRYQGQDFPQLGTICMNLSAMQATSEMQIGNVVQLISEDPHSPQSIAQIAQLAETIPYEILIRLEKGIRREVVE